jgi:hypothetical protein
MLIARCMPADNNSSVSIDLFVIPVTIPCDAWCSFAYTLKAPPACSYGDTTSLQLGKKNYFGTDLFEVGPMPGGWDEAAWAAKGLPASGTLPVKLTVSKVGHMVNTAR